jgi:hypothetical protein
MISFATLFEEDLYGVSFLALDAPTRPMVKLPFVARILLNDLKEVSIGSLSKTTGTMNKDLSIPRRRALNTIYY